MKDEDIAVLRQKIEELKCQIKNQNIVIANNDKLERVLVAAGFITQSKLNEVRSLIED